MSNPMAEDLNFNDLQFSINSRNLSFLNKNPSTNSSLLKSENSLYLSKDLNFNYGYKEVTRRRAYLQDIPEGFSNLAFIYTNELFSQFIQNSNARQMRLSFYEDLLLKESTKFVVIKQEDELKEETVVEADEPIFDPDKDKFEIDSEADEEEQQSSIKLGEIHKKSSIIETLDQALDIKQVEDKLCQIEDLEVKLQSEGNEEDILNEPQELENFVYLCNRLYDVSLIKLLLATANQFHSQSLNIKLLKEYEDRSEILKKAVQNEEDRKAKKLMLVFLKDWKEVIINENKELTKMNNQGENEITVDVGPETEHIMKHQEEAGVIVQNLNEEQNNNSFRNDLQKLNSSSNKDMKKGVNEEEQIPSQKIDDHIDINSNDIEIANAEIETKKNDETKLIADQGDYELQTSVINKVDQEGSIGKSNNNEIKVIENTQVQSQTELVKSESHLNKKLSAEDNKNINEKEQSNNMIKHSSSDNDIQQEAAPKIETQAEQIKPETILENKIDVDQSSLIPNIANEEIKYELAGQRDEAKLESINVVESETNQVIRRESIVAENNRSYAKFNKDIIEKSVIDEESESPTTNNINVLEPEVPKQSVVSNPKLSQFEPKIENEKDKETPQLKAITSNQFSGQNEIKDNKAATVNEVNSTQAAEVQKEENLGQQNKNQIDLKIPKQEIEDKSTFKDNTLEVEKSSDAPAVKQIDNINQPNLNIEKKPIEGIVPQIINNQELPIQSLKGENAQEKTINKQLLSGSQDKPVEIKEENFSPQIKQDEGSNKIKGASIADQIKMTLQNQYKNNENKVIEKIEEVSKTKVEDTIKQELEKLPPQSSTTPDSKEKQEAKIIVEESNNSEFSKLPDLKVDVETKPNVEETNKLKTEKTPLQSSTPPITEPLVQNDKIIKTQNSKKDFGVLPESTKSPELKNKVEVVDIKNHSDLEIRNNPQDEDLQAKLIADEDNRIIVNNAKLTSSNALPDFESNKLEEINNKEIRKGSDNAIFKFSEDASLVNQNNILSPDEQNKSVDEEKLNKINSIVLDAELKKEISLKIEPPHRQAETKEKAVNNLQEVSNHIIQNKEEDMLQKKEEIDAIKEPSPQVTKLTSTSKEIKQQIEPTLKCEVVANHVEEGEPLKVDNLQKNMLNKVSLKTPEGLHEEPQITNKAKQSFGIQSNVKEELISNSSNVNAPPENKEKSVMLNESVAIHNTINEDNKNARIIENKSGPVQSELKHSTLSNQEISAYDKHTKKDSTLKIETNIIEKKKEAETFQPQPEKINELKNSEKEKPEISHEQYQITENLNEETFKDINHQIVTEAEEEEHFHSCNTELDKGNVNLLQNATPKIEIKDEAEENHKNFRLSIIPPEPAENNSGDNLRNSLNFDNDNNDARRSSSNNNLTSQTSLFSPSTRRIGAKRSTAKLSEAFKIEDSLKEEFKLKGKLRVREDDIISELNENSISYRFSQKQILDAQLQLVALAKKASKHLLLKSALEVIQPIKKQKVANRKLNLLLNIIRMKNAKITAGLSKMFNRYRNMAVYLKENMNIICYKCFNSIVNRKWKKAKKIFISQLKLELLKVCMKIRLNKLFTIIKKKFGKKLVLRVKRRSKWTKAKQTMRKLIQDKPKREENIRFARCFKIWKKKTLNLNKNNAGKGIKRKLKVKKINHTHSSSPMDDFRSTKLSLRDYIDLDELKNRIEDALSAKTGQRNDMLGNDINQMLNLLDDKNAGEENSKEFNLNSIKQRQINTESQVNTNLNFYVNENNVPNNSNFNPEVSGHNQNCNSTYSSLGKKKLLHPISMSNTAKQSMFKETSKSPEQTLINSKQIINLLLENPIIKKSTSTSNALSEKYMNDPNNPYSTYWGQRILSNRFGMKLILDHANANGLKNLKLVRINSNAPHHKSRESNKSSITQGNLKPSNNSETKQRIVNLNVNLNFNVSNYPVIMCHQRPNAYSNQSSHNISQYKSNCKEQGFYKPPQIKLPNPHQTIKFDNFVKK